MTCAGGLRGCFEFDIVILRCDVAVSFSVWFCDCVVLLVRLTVRVG